MKKLLVVGVIVLFLGVAIAPSINANIGELSVDIPQDKDTLQLESEFQRIRAYIEMQSEEDCGCSDANTTEWNFPGICTLLYPFLVIGAILMSLFSYYKLYNRMEELAQDLNCYWASPEYLTVYGIER